MKRLILGCIALVLAAQCLQAKDENLIAGKKVEADAKIKKGDRLVGVWEKKNYPIEVLEVRRNNKLKVLWGGELYDDINAGDLYYVGDATPTRKKRSSPLSETYRGLDKNGDGQIGMYEWDRAKFAEFKKLDKNHDGFLTPQELAERKSTTASSTGDAKATTENSQAKTESKPEPTSEANDPAPTIQAAEAPERETQENQSPE